MTTIDLNQLGSQAVALHRSGNLRDAERLYLQILAAAPDSFSARHMLGILRAQQGRNAEALEMIGGALKLNPASPDAHFNHGNVLKNLGRNGEALESFDRALALRPDYPAALGARGAVLRSMGQHGDALASHDRSLALQPGSAELLSQRGQVLADMQRYAEALAAFDAALAIRADFETLTYRGNVLQALGRQDDALASFDAALAIKPNSAEVLNNRGSILLDLKRPADALENFDAALAIKPQMAQILYNRGNALQDLKRHAEALDSFDRALAGEPGNAMAWNNRGNALQDLWRFDEALVSFDRALALRPDYAEALYNRGKALCETNHIPQGFAEFTRAAHLFHDGRPLPQEAALAHRGLHDREQQEYLRSIGAAHTVSGPLHLVGGARLDGPAINPANAQSVTTQWQESKPQIVVIDNLLTPEALAELRRFCWQSNMWRKANQSGYMGAFPEDGFTCPLLAQIGDEFRDTFPAIFHQHPLIYAWSFKYDSRLSGTEIHADAAAVNVNFWITPDDSNLDPEHGGLVVWDKAAPLDWEFDKFNGDVAATRQFLADSGATPLTVPYRANRAVIFDSDLFHETDKITFKDGYLDRRINITLLYGRRELA